jgi:hypothetical protein
MVWLPHGHSSSPLVEDKFCCVCSRGGAACVALLACCLDAVLLSQPFPTADALDLGPCTTLYPYLLSSKLFDAKRTGIVDNLLPVTADRYPAGEVVFSDEAFGLSLSLAAT